MVSLLEACRTDGFPADPVLVVSNRPEAEGLSRAAALGAPTRAVDHRAFAGRTAFEAELNRMLDSSSTELIALAGFMRVLTASFVKRWEGRLINIHPSLLPAFPGLDTHERALAAGVAVHGCSVHHVVPEVDAGAVIGRASVLVHADDNAETLAARVLRAEHLLYPRCLAAVASGERLSLNEIVAASGDPVFLSAPA
ncbi:phosphoribosylglycinamide formyltransferase [bacterium]|nr:phosphoribosylglycinamide formyltransferase [bacterium]